MEISVTRARTVLSVAAVATGVLAFCGAPQAVAATGYQDLAAGAGVYTSTTVEYATNWWIKGGNSPYMWYLRKVDGTVVQSGGPTTGWVPVPVVPGNNYYLQVFNDSKAGGGSGVVESWRVCYTTSSWDCPTP